MKRYSTEESKVRHREEQRRYCLKYPERRAKTNRESRKRTGFRKIYRVRWKLANPEKRAAYRSVHRAIKNGTLLRPSECSNCHKLCKPEAHHPDYAKRFDVVWLCRICHLAIDGRILRVSSNQYFQVKAEGD